MNKGHPKPPSEIYEFKIRSFIDKDTYQLKHIIKDLTFAGPLCKFGIYSEMI